MRVNARDIFSRQTIGSWRNLIAVATSLIFVEALGYNDKSWPLLSRDVSSDEFAIIASFAIIGLTIIHIVNWYSDYIGFTKWFKENEFPKGDFDSLGTVNSGENPTYGLLKRIENVVSAVERADSFTKGLAAIELELDSGNTSRKAATNEVQKKFSTDQRNLTRINHSLRDLESIHKKMGTNWRCIAMFSKILVFGWYFSVPIVLSGIALFLIFLHW